MRRQSAQPVLQSERRAKGHQASRELELLDGMDSTTSIH